MLTGQLQPITNTEDFEIVGTITDADTGDLLDLSSLTEIELVIRDPGSGSSMISLTKSGGTIVISDTGVFTASITEAQANLLDAKTYNIGIRYTNAGKTRSFLAGTLPVIDGVVE